MFSSIDLIHLVFANETDTYYCNDLLKLDLHQYLWLKLHENYSSVYFLSLSEGTPSVKTYGDLKCKAYEPGRRLFKLMGLESEIGELGKWIHKQLMSKRSEPAAFVCSLEDFCKASKYPDWANTLNSIAGEKNRTGILVLTVPVSVERSRPLFLHDPVFEYLQENAILDVRTGTLREMYGAIKRNKGESCVFLNTFSRNSVYSILLHVVLEQKGRFLAPKDMETVTEYLVRYMASLELQHDQPLFKSQIPGPYMQFRELYDQLKDESVWKRLTNRCLQKKDLSDGQAGSAGPAMEYHINRDRGCYAGKCMMLRIPNGIKRLDTQAERAADILLAIQRELLRPKNRDENTMLSAKAAGFLARLEEVSSDDLDTYKRILKAIRFCVTWMYTREHSEEEKQVLEITASLEEYINISVNCCRMRRNVEQITQASGSGTVTDIKIRQARDRLAAQEKLLRTYQDLVSASIMDLSMPSFSDRTVKQIEKLKQEMEKYGSARNAVNQGGIAGSGGLSDPSHDRDRPEDDVGIYTLDVTDYGSTPPV